MKRLAVLLLAFAPAAHAGGLGGGAPMGPGSLLGWIVAALYLTALAVCAALALLLPFLVAAGRER